MEQRLPVEELEEMAHIEVGEALRRTRMHYGQTLEDIESALRIRASQIHAIEQGDTKQLPGRVYVIGFVRSYAEYLGLDGGKVVQLFKAQYMDTQANDLLSFPVPASETKTPPAWLVALSLLIVIIFVAGLYSYARSDHSNALEITNVPEDIKSHINQDILVKKPSFEAMGLTQLPEDQEEVIEQDPVIEVENMGSDEAQKTGIILNIVDSSWVEIKDGEGKVLVSNILEKGDQYFVPDSPGLSMSLGNAANVEIVLDGRPLKPLGGNGDVRRDIPLDSSYLKTLEFQDSEEIIQENSEEKTEP